MNKIKMVLVLTGFLYSITSCSSETDDSGECKLTCSGAVPVSTNLQGSSEIGIQYLGPVQQLPTCSTLSTSPEGYTAEDGAAAAPVRVQFRFTKTITSHGFAGQADIEEEEEEDKLALKANLVPTSFSRIVPLAGVEFTPSVTGTVAASLTEPSVATYNAETGTTTPAHLAGIHTPRNEWCTDSCGVATVEVWLRCEPGSGMDIQLKSGAVNSTSERIEYFGAQTGALIEKSSNPIRRFAHNELRNPGFSQSPKLDLSPYDFEGSKPWIDHFEFDKVKLAKQ